MEFRLFWDKTAYFRGEIGPFPGEVYPFGMGVKLCPFQTKLRHFSEKLCLFRTKLFPIRRNYALQSENLSFWDEIAPFQKIGEAGYPDLAPCQLPEGGSWQPILAPSQLPGWRGKLATYSSYLSAPSQLPGRWGKLATYSSYLSATWKFFLIYKIIKQLKFVIRVPISLKYTCLLEETNHRRPNVPYNAPGDDISESFSFGHFFQRTCQPELSNCLINTRAQQRFHITIYKLYF